MKINNDSVVLITPQELKLTNLIFLHHSQLLEENEVLNEQVTTLKELYAEQLKLDSAYRSSILYLQTKNSESEKTIEQQTSKINSLKTRNKVWRITGISSFIGLIIVCLL